MMRVLILEDDPARKAQFEELFKDHHVRITSIASTAIDLLMTERWDLLSLDHDLGDKVMVESGPGTGYEVAVYLEEFPERKPACIMIHSLNTVGAGRMRQALPEAAMFPGVWFCASVEQMVNSIGDEKWDGLIDCSEVEQRGLQPPSLLHTNAKTGIGIIDIAGGAVEQDRNVVGTERNEEHIDT